MAELYADVILPIPAQAMTFAVPESMFDAIKPGCRVTVSLGAKKYYTGIIKSLTGKRPPYPKIKNIDRLIEPDRAVSVEQLRLWDWISEYYMCPLGLVMRSALPVQLKASGGTLEEALQKEFRPKTVKYVRLGSAVRSEADMHTALDSFSGAKARRRAVIDYLDLAGEIDYTNPAPVPRSVLNISTHVLKALVSLGIFEVFEAEPADKKTESGYRFPVLSEHQQTAYGTIKKGFEKKDVALLNGITGSGKTEIYIKLIAEALESGGSVLYMLPEIAISSHMIGRLKSHFSDNIILYHSKISDRKRAEIYRELLGSDGGKFIVGVRSSLFLPLPKLSLVIVDEEHDSSYKQSDSAPRYNGRDTAVILGALHGAKTILGSATPSLESYYNAVCGKYVYAEMTERYGGVPLPKIIAADILRAARRGEKISHFTKALTDRISEALENKEQVILFQNRRGFSPYLECGSCGWMGNCPHCNVTLTLHKNDGNLRCHYCGFEMRTPMQCPKCSAAELIPRGFGTEKVEDELAMIFPGAVIDRMDADTASAPGNYNRIIRDFESRSTDILVGTQMITKGFDFEGVSLVGILNADNMLNYPDFRASEKAFDMMMQVGGRAGRRGKEGTVVIQTSQPENTIIKLVMNNDYKTMAAIVLAERKNFLYPPYSRLIEITLRHREYAVVWQCANEIASLARPVFGRRLLGPEAPPVDRIRGLHLARMILKIEKSSSASDARKLLKEILDNVGRRKEFRSMDIITDVDPA